MQPAANAVMNPMNKAVGEIPVVIDSYPNSMTFRTSSKASPKIGGITIKNENCAKCSFLFPNIRPVAIVEPERERPGITAHACATPIIKASFIDKDSF